MCELQVKPQYFDKICNGRIKHLIVCKETGIQVGDQIFLLSNDNRCLVQVEYVDCEGSQNEEDYCILGVKTI
ncbi:DUF3850 domain-containing protein [uncultured Thomasclavelia sp.]|uniref:DUF3850 domain-containing protein n=1 Tax=uncultured Thomasclavelia sp. TaxID=3025759 RepID=UPI0025DAC9EC|nr:DUF3850 domain-containing protein [uncultured Thomasclavelia sp.]